MDALIGHTGFVGGALLGQRPFDRAYNRATLAEAAGVRFDRVICAGAPGLKWQANLDPDADLRNLQVLVEGLRRMRARRLVLVSTVDVFGQPAVAHSEAAQAGVDALTAYGRHRLWLEEALRERFPDMLTVRLGGLVGPGLRKNPLFDLRNGARLDALDARARLQVYPIARLAADIEAAEAAGLSLVHLTAPPLSLGEIAGGAFGCALSPRGDPTPPAVYDVRTAHAGRFAGSEPGYACGRRDSWNAILVYARSPQPAGAT